jgi:hypothetical protein
MLPPESVPLSMYAVKVAFEVSATMPIASASAWLGELGEDYHDT